MNQDISGISKNFSKPMNPQQFDQIVEAIIAGKYSWACVLMLRIVGYNPLHYIPYRTYNRLLKENTRSQNIKNESSDINPSSRCLSKMKDIA